MSMQNTNELPDDPLAAALDANNATPAADDRLRAAVFTKTVGVIRFRRRLKRCALAAGLLGCYLAGVTTMGIFAGNRQQQHPPVPAPTIADEPKSPAPPLQHKAAPPEKRQIAANAKKPSGFESWRHIGDHYLRNAGDVSLAVAGYSEAISLASAEERRISPGQDNWLMMALKQDARFQEKRHVQQN
jgi:hypothetical protein